MQTESLLKIVNSKGWVNNALIVLSLILPGFTYFYFTKSELFWSTDFSKLIMLSIAYSVPSYAILYQTLKWSPFNKDIQKIVKNANKLKSETAILHATLKKASINPDLTQLKSQIDRIEQLSDIDCLVHSIVATMILVLTYTSAIKYLLGLGSGADFLHNLFITPMIFLGIVGVINVYKLKVLKR